MQEDYGDALKLCISWDKNYQIQFNRIGKDSGYFEFVHIEPIGSDIDGSLRHRKWQVKFGCPST